MGLSPASVHLHIERLVLEGFPARDRARIAAALQGELARALQAHGLPPGLLQGGDRRALAAPPIRAGAAPEGIGRAAARSVYGGLAR